MSRIAFAIYHPAATMHDIIDEVRTWWLHRHGKHAVWCCVNCGLGCCCGLGKDEKR